jgi:NitT/TauT family transport system ATP-binding protein
MQEIIRAKPSDEIATAPAQVHFGAVSKRFIDPAGESIEALNAIDLDIHAGEFVCLLGPSGCGKSTLLNILAGFIKPTSGDVTVNGTPVGAPGPDRAMVFQDYALFPWMTVAANIAFGLELKRMPRSAIAERVEALLEMLHLTEFARRYPKDLSGGMRQRVAIARVLAVAPPILLMDEPFGALDALTRQTLQDELLRIWEELGKTVIFVTHSIEEAIYLADRIIVLTYRPGTIKSELAVRSLRPRDPSGAAFNALKRDITGLVMEEQHRFVRAEYGGI